MAQIFKAKTLVANSGKFAYEVSAPNLVSNTGDQNIGGNKTFDLFPIVSGNKLITGVDLTSYATNINLYATGSTLNNKIDSLSGYVDLSNNNTVFTTGDQTINGLKDFTTRPTVNTIPVLLSGEVNTTISGVLYSAQINIKNNNGSTIYKGQPVYVSSAAGTNILVKLASNSGEQASSKTLGLVYQTSLAQNAQGTIVTEGLLQGFNTNAGEEGDPIWLGPSGSLIFGLANKPYAPNHLVYLGVLTRKHADQGEVFVKIQNGFELEELHNVNINHRNALADKNIIRYDSLSGIWFNDTINSVLPNSIVYNTGNQIISGIKTFDVFPIISGNPFITGVNLTSYATSINLATTGSTLDSKINSLSGYVNSQDNVLSGQIVSTGTNLNNKINSLSGLFTTYTGSLDSTFATDAQLFTTGSILDNKINSLSGYVNSQDILFSGQTFNTGSRLDNKINSLSGYVDSKSIVLPTTIVYTTGNQTISGIKTFAENTVFGDPSQGDFLVISGNTFSIYGSGNFTSGLFVNGVPVLTGVDLSSYATVSNLFSTGSNLDNKINSLSGLFTSYTGNLDTNFASDAQLFTTGSTLDNKVNSLSGYVNSQDIILSGQTAFTGSILDNKINSLSGHANSQNIILSGQIASSGSNLYNSILSLSGLFTGYTGSLDATFASDAQLFATGSTLDNKINSLSGVSVLTFGDQLISGNKTFFNNVSVSGSGIFNALDLNNIDILSLSGVDISITNGNVSLTNRPAVNGTGVVLIGELNPIIVNTGSILDNKINSLSGYLNSQDIIISGQTFSTGSRLDNKINSLSGYVDSKDIIFSGQIALTGSNLYNSIVALSGLFTTYTGNLDATFATDAQLFATGSVLDNKINALSGYVSGISAGGLLPSTIVYTTGDQLISGNKTFLNNISVSGTGNFNNVRVSSIDKLFLSGIDILITGNSSINVYNPVYISGNAVLTGVNLSSYATISNLASTGSILDNKINALSGYVSGISLGGLLPSTIVYTTGNQLISGNKTFLNNISVSGTGNFNNVRVSSIDNLFLSGIDIIITGNSSINIYNPIYISGNPVLTGVDLNSYATTSNLVSTGLILDNKINSLSGYVNSRDLLFSGQTASTGSILDSKINALSGLFAGYTGSLDNTFATDAQLFSTGSTLDNKINSLSGYVNSRDILFSGQIASTGSILDNKINNLSGYINTSDSNIVFTTGNQTIGGIKTFEVGNGDSKVIISGSDAFDYALSVVNNSNQGNVLFLKKGTNPGGGAVSENFVIKAVDRADDLIFTLKSTQAGTNRAGFFCDPDGVNDAGGPNVSADSVVISGRTYTIGEIDNQLQYILSDSNSIQAVNPVYSYTGGLFFDNNGLNLKFVDKNGNYSQLNPIEVTSGNDVLINGNSSFGIYQQGTLYPNGAPVDNSINRLTRYLNSLNFYYGIVSGTNFVSGLKPGNLLYYTTKNNASNNFGNSTKIRAKARPYMVVDEASNYNNSYNVITGPMSPGNNGNFSFLKFNNNSQYSGLAIKQLIFNPTIQNAYRSYNLWSGVNIEVKPKNIHLETFIDVNVKSGNYWSIDNLGLSRYDNNITVKKPKSFNFTQSHVLNFKLNFERDDRVTRLANYPNRIVTIYNPDNIPTITITGYDYEFSQKLRLILNTDGSLKEW